MNSLIKTTLPKTYLFNNTQTILKTISMTKISHFFKTYCSDTQGGLEEAIRQIGKYSVKNGYNVNVVSVANNPIHS
jgi:hypothetical protein